MTNPIVRIHDIKTNEIIDREMNDDEFIAYQKLSIDAAAAEAEAAVKATAKAALLARLGLTADEFATLL